MTDQDQKLATGRRWVAVHVASFDALPSALPLPYETFVLCLAADGRTASDQVLGEHCSQLLRAGARYVCVWGPDASRVHDVCDLSAGDLGLNGDGAVVMTSWHEDESLEEAVWFAANAAFPDDAYAEAAGALVVVSVGPEEWHSRIAAYLQAGAPVPDEA